MTKALRILFLEDAPEDAELAIATLEEAGYSCEWERIESREDFLDRLDQGKCDLVLSDFNLPSFDGISAAKIFVERGKDIPFILISGTLDEEAAVESLKAGASDFVLKTKMFRLPSVVERALKETDEHRRNKKVREENARLAKQVAAERQRLNNIVSSVPGVVWEAWGQPDMANQQMNFVSEYVETMLGYSVEEWVSTPNFWLTIVHPEDKERAAEIASAAFTGGDDSIQEFRWIAKDGHAVWVESHSVTICDENHHPLGVRGVTIDITERKRFEDALTDSEERYRLLFEKNPLPMWVYDLGTLAFIEVNDAAVTHYGYSRDEFHSMTIMDIRPSDDITAVMRSVGEDKHDPQAGQAWTHTKKDGTVIDVEIASHALNFAGRPARLVLAKDITETKLAQAALTESEERNRDLVENALDIIYTHDLTGNYTSVNQAGEKITGYTRAETLAMNLADSVAPEYLETARKMIAEKLAGNEITAYEVEIIAKDGHRVAVEINTRIIYEKGIAVRVQGIARDITERKQLEDQFRQAQKMESIGVLAGGIAHDFNNLLTAINGYSELALRRMTTDDPSRGNIEEVKNAGERAAVLTGQLLAFSRKKLLQPTVHNLNPLITDIEKMLRRILRENIELRTVLDPELGNINADPGQIEQVIMNLAVNARDAMLAGGKLTIETQNIFLDEDYVSEHIAISSGPFVRIIVTDTGVGMDSKTKQSVFEPFFTTKGIGKGTGLGLSTVYGIIKQSGGDIMVYSELGHGTTFKIYLPRVDEVLDKSRSTNFDNKNLSGTETILLVEDDEIVRALVREVLTGNGYKVLESSSGREALSICSTYSEPIHLLLTDVIMPKMSGNELKTEVVKLLPEIKILFMSGYTDDAISDGGFLDSGTAFIEKPYTPDGLALKVREVLES